MPFAIRTVCAGMCAPLALGALLTACAPSPFNQGLLDQLERDLDAVDARERSLVERAERLAFGTVNHASERAGAQAISDSPDLQGASVEELVALALSHNPAIAAAKQRVLRLRERIVQAASLEDPVFSVTPIGEMSETAAGQVDVMTSVSQRLPFPGKLTARSDVARAEAQFAERELEQVRLRVAGDVRRAHWRLYETARAIEITRRSADILEQALGAARARQRAGRGGQDAVLRISVERQRIEQELLELAQRRDSALAMLNALLDRAPGAPIPDPPSIDVPDFDEQLEALLAQARRRNPQVRAALERLGRFQAQRRLAGLQRAPDVAISASFNAVDDDGLAASATGEDQWWIGFSFNLPIWADRLDAAEREATRGALEAAGEAADASRRVEFAVLDAHARIGSLRDQAILLRDVIVPEARLAVESSLAAYGAGAGDFLTVIDNWRTALRVELMLARSVAEMQRALADLREAVAASDNHAWPAPTEPDIEQTNTERTSHD